MSSNLELIHKLALGLIPNVGVITAKKLISFLGSIDAIFDSHPKELRKIPGIGELAMKSLKLSEKYVERAEQEIEFIEKNDIQFIFYTDKDFPSRLKHCDDGPIGLFYKGALKKNDKIISIVGTRNATDYGIDNCYNLISQLKDFGYNPIIVSGLAFGIDAAAHKAALKYDLHTYAVLGNGLHTIYPGVHRKLSDKIIQSGALISEFYSNTRIDKNNFVKRNRIIAGLADATIVVESKEKGGALITADIANSYNRDVLAFSGRNNDITSSGCNWLIKTNRAALIENAEDLEYALGWTREERAKEAFQKSLFENLSHDEEIIVNILKENNNAEIDKIYLLSQMPVSKVSTLLLNLEFSGIVKCLPGKVYKLT